MKLSRQTPADFDLAMAVSSHGFFALAPNRWEPDPRTFTTVVHAADVVLEARIRPASRGGRVVLRIDVPGVASLSADQRRGLLQAVDRTLRLDESLAEFHAMCAGDGELARAAELRFGRLLRSETFFEDVVKTMCTCNITWKQTIGIVRRLVAGYGTPAVNNPQVRAFPTPEALAAADPEQLRRDCGLGYRAPWVVDFARRLVAGEFDATACHDPNRSTTEVYKYLRTINGVGDYAASHICILLGRYDRLAVDSELVAHYGRRFPRRKPTPANIQKHYARYAPYAALVYWWELWSHYADADGHPGSWTDDG